MTLELTVCVRDVAAARGELDVTSSVGMDEVFGVHASANAAVASIAGSPVASTCGRAERAGCSVVGTPALSGPSR
jgi:hypothetical protein